MGYHEGVHSMLGLESKRARRIHFKLDEEFKVLVNGLMGEYSWVCCKLSGELVGMHIYTDNGKHGWVLLC